MNAANFETLVMDYKAIRFNDEKWEEADTLLERIADIHTENPALYEPVLNKHKVSY